MGENKQTHKLKGWKKKKKNYVAKCQRDSLLLGSLAGPRSGFDLFVWPWPGTDTNPAPDTIDHTVRDRERERWREKQKVHEVG